MLSDSFLPNFFKFTHQTNPIFEVITSSYPLQDVPMLSGHLGHVAPGSACSARSGNRFILMRCQMCHKALWETNQGRKRHASKVNEICQTLESSQLLDLSHCTPIGYAFPRTLFTSCDGPFWLALIKEVNEWILKRFQIQSPLQTEKACVSPGKFQNLFPGCCDGTIFMNNAWCVLNG